MAHIRLLDEALELAVLLRPAWAEVRDGIPGWHPRNEGEETESEGTESETETEEAEEDWKAHSRRHERDAKKARREADELRKQLADRAEQDKSEQDKQLDKARQEAADAAKAEVTGQMRKRILNAEIRAQAAGRFADPDDAIRLLDLDDDVFDDQGDIRSADLVKALDELLERKPHLKSQGHRPTGSSDAGRGSSDNGLEETNPDKLAAMVPRMY